MDNPPNNNIHTIVKAQIVFLLSTLTEDNFERNQAEIRSVRASCSFRTAFAYDTRPYRPLLPPAAAVRTAWDRNIPPLHPPPHSPLPVPTPFDCRALRVRYLNFAHVPPTCSRNTASCATLSSRIVLEMGSIGVKGIYFGTSTSCDLRIV